LSRPQSAGTVCSRLPDVSKATSPPFLRARTSCIDECAWRRFTGRSIIAC
jgi:hypothetical protein